MEQRLEQNWRMRRTGVSSWLTASVPGSVYTDLLRHKEMEDPYWKDNEGKALAQMDYDYEYETTFSVENELMDCDKVLLHFDGIDTISDVYLNGEKLGETINMHRIWEFSVGKKLRPDQNILKIVLHSPTRYIKKKFEESPVYGSEDAMDGFVHIRKAHYMFGWDWGAHLPDAGIFRAVKLIGIKKARLDSVYPVQEHKDGQVNILLKTTIEKAVEEPVFYDVVLTSPDGEEQVYKNSPTIIDVKNPKLWWPNGYGEQPLYQLKIYLFDQQKNLLDQQQMRIGLRTVTMQRQKDQWGESFAHEVNGKAIFAMGADYIPEDHILGRTNREKTKELLTWCKEANFNAIRVWGGGCYPEDWFFDLCDEMGILVWQDFLFACAVYELTDEFRANIKQEFIDNVKRIRHHACLGLWCGNNEMEQFVSEGHHWVTRHKEVRDYLIMYEDLIPAVLKEYDPNTFYWPASPSSGGSFDEPNDPNRGDVHYWEVWHGNKPFTEYRKHFFRYASEFGFQSFPSLKTIETFTDDSKDWNPFSYIMEKHQRNDGANGKIMNYMQQNYQYPMSFPDFIYLSQLLQADAIRYGVEHFRRNRGRCMGAIYWQLNDCWPVISWSSIDYCGRWKALHYYAKRFFAPYLISCEEEGMMTAKEEMNREHYKVEKTIRLHVANETLKEEKFLVQRELRHADGSIIDQKQWEIIVPALSGVWLEKEEFPEADLFNQYISYSLFKAKEKVSEGTVIFSLPKYFHYQEPKLQYQIEGNEIIVSASAYAKSVEIQNEEENLILSDNYFDLNADSKRVQILAGEKKGIKIRSLK